MAETTKTQHGGGQSFNAAPVVNSIPKVSAGTDDLQDSGLRTIEVAITSAQILAMRATPVALVAAPGAGKVLQFLGALLILDFGVAYSENSGNTNLVVENATGTDVSEVLEATGFIDATADAMRHMVPAILGSVLLANEGLYLKNAGSAEIITGTGVMRAKVTYAVWDTGL